MKAKKEMKLFSLEHAKGLAEKLVGMLQSSGLFSDVEVVGSIRRECKEVHNIDIVAVPATGIVFNHDILKGDMEGVPYKVYITGKDVLEVVRLIRTGSQIHNVRLSSLARKMGYKLKNVGLVDATDKVIDVTEVGIITKLVGKYIEPVDRV